MKYLLKVLDTIALSVMIGVWLVASGITLGSIVMLTGLGIKASCAIGAVIGSVVLAYSVMRGRSVEDDKDKVA